jgi:hypothetical protein
MSNEQEDPVVLLSAPSEDDDDDDDDDGHHHVMEEEKEEIGLEEGGDETVQVEDPYVAENEAKEEEKEEIKSEPEATSPPTIEDIQREFGGDAEAPEPNTEPTPEPATAAASAPAASSEDEEAPSHRRRWRQIILCFSILLLIVIALQGVIIGILVNRDNDDNDGGNNNPDRDIDGDNEANQDDAEEDPTEAPTAEPTVTPMTSSSSFQSIAGLPESQRLMGVSNCDDCQETVRFPLEFQFGGSPVRAATVSSDGSLDLTCDTGTTCATIDVLAISLAIPTQTADGGGVYLLPQSSTSLGTAQTKQNTVFEPAVYDKLVISWESIPLYEQTDDEAVVNVQVTLFGDSGEVEICFGQGDVNGNTFRTGVWDIEQQLYYPAVGDPFDAFGFANDFPINTCQRFLDGNDVAIPVKPTDPPAIGTATKPPQARPTTAPTATYTTITSTSAFVPLSGRPGASVLEQASTCDECQETIQLPFRYTYLGTYPVRELDVSSNGRIYINDCGIDDTACAVLNVVFADLLPQYTNNTGAIWVYDASADVAGDERAWKQQVIEPDLPWGAYIISWESIPFCCELVHADDSTFFAYVSAQAHIYPNGRIDMCWGDGYLPSDQSITASILDLVEGGFYPATDRRYFDEMGQTPPGVYPSFTCQTLLGTSFEELCRTSCLSILRSNFISIFQIPSCLQLPQHLPHHQHFHRGCIPNAFGTCLGSQMPEYWMRSRLVTTAKNSCVFRSLLGGLEILKSLSFRFGAMVKFESAAVPD